MTTTSTLIDQQSHSNELMRAAPDSTPLQHPLPIGTTITATSGEWDLVDEPARGQHAGDNAAGKIVSVHPCETMGWAYGVVFGSGHWLYLTELHLAGPNGYIVDVQEPPADDGITRVFFDDGRYACLFGAPNVIEAVATVHRTRAVSSAMPRGDIVAITLGEDPMETAARLRFLATDRAGAM